ncbi:type II toxin-antitoxin system VapC family toxin [archaeon]|nr:type II toxin-antitoxin system VapC family toxin [archaeon]
MQVFVDSNIFLDYYFDRKNHVKPLGEFAFQFIKRAVSCEFELVVCWQVLKEVRLNAGLTEKEAEERILHDLLKAGKLIEAKGSATQSSEAEKLSKKLNLPFTDCLYAVLARDLGIPVVSRDNHFKELGFVHALAPEEL